MILIIGLVYIFLSIIGLLNLIKNVKNHNKKFIIFKNMSIILFLFTLGLLAIIRDDFTMIILGSIIPLILIFFNTIEKYIYKQQ